MTGTGIEMINKSRQINKVKSRKWENYGQPDSAGNMDFEVVKDLERARNTPDQM